MVLGGEEGILLGAQWGVGVVIDVLGLHCLAKVELVVLRLRYYRKFFTLPLVHQDRRVTIFLECQGLGFFNVI